MKDILTYESDLRTPRSDTNKDVSKRSMKATVISIPLFHFRRGKSLIANLTLVVREQVPEQGAQLPVLAPAGGEGEGGVGRGGRAQLQDQDLRGPQEERLLLRGQVRGIL